MKPSEIITAAMRTKFATDAGTRRHAAMRRIVLNADMNDIGDAELIAHIRADERLHPLFDAHAMTEVPIAGVINGRMLSRRIDRMRVWDDTRRVVFLDYKTDSDRNAMADRYVRQMNEYAALLGEIYPGYAISGYILWLHDWMLDAMAGDAKNLESDPDFGL